MENFKFILKQVATIVACFAVCFTWMGCPVEPEPLKNDKAVFEAFTFAGIVGTATINESASTITAKASATTDLTKIAPVFTVSQGAIVTVNGTPQVSGSTQNNFTNSVIYVVISEDAKTNKPWTVSITKEGSGTGELNDLANFETFTFTGIDGTATIKVTDATITAKALATADLTTIKAKFTVSKGATVKVGTTAQVSEQTINNFTNPVTYNIVSEDGKTTRNWVVTITKEGIIPGEVIELTNAMINASANVTLPVAIYQVKTDLTLQGGNTLTFAPGTFIRFDKDKRLTANANAKIIAKGTAGQLITFTSSMQELVAGNWYGVYLNSTNNEFEWCVFEYGSGNSYNWGMLHLNDGTASIKNSTFRNSKFSGILLEGANGRFTAFEGNTITNCGENEANSFPIRSYTTINSLSVMGENNTITTEKGIGVGGGTMTQNVTIKAYVPYLFRGDQTINNPAILTVEPGATLKFDDNIRMTFNGGSKIIADGTASQIKFTSSRLTPDDNGGNWYGIYIVSGDGSDFKNCIFEYGSGNSSGWGMLHLNNSKASITNCTFRNALFNGILLEGANSVFTKFDNNTITNCGETKADSYPIRAWTTINSLSVMGENNTIVTEKGIGVSGGSMTQNVTIRAYVDYIFRGNNTINNSVLTIDPGATLKFDDNVQITLNSGGKIIADGTASSITFTSSRLTPDNDGGHWYGIYIYSEGSDFKNCIFEYGSGNSSGWGMLLLKDIKASFTNCTFRNSQYNGILLEGAGSGFTKFEGNTITNCGEKQVDSYPIRAYTTIMSLSTMGVNNTITSDKGIGIAGSTVNGNLTLNKYLYTVRSDLTISNATSGATLTIKPGAKLMFANNVGLLIGAGGKIVANGKPEAAVPEDKIYFTGTTAQKGWWDGLRFNNNNALDGSLLNYCDISYGGSSIANASTDRNGNISCYGNIGSATLSVTNCNITNSRAWGIWINSPANPTIGTNTYSNNGPTGNSNVGRSANGDLVIR